MTIMGWFWADNTVSSSRLTAPHPLPSHSDAQPPPSCPMHNKMSQSAPLPPPPTTSDRPSACPVKHDAAASKPAQSKDTPSYISKLNPLNYMPELANKREHNEQRIKLPLDREASSIPRGDGQGNWEYPSPQQMYNAMLRKGYTDTPAEHVESMVAVHNFLNEGAWEEIRAWEHRFNRGLGKGWEYCSRGEEGYSQMLALEQLRRRRGEEALSEPKLLRFEGRPSDMTPKAKMLSFMAWLYPSQFPDNPPFDRHDWYVERNGANGTKQEKRYIIDYYR